MAGDITTSSCSRDDAASILADFNAEESGPLTFFIGWKTGKSYHLRRLDLREEAENEFRGIANDLIQGSELTVGLLGRQSEPWSPEAEIFAETYLECSICAVGDTPKLARRPRDERLLEVLKAAEDLEIMEAGDLQKRAIGLYGFAIGDPGERVVFIRRSNPRRGLSKGRFFGIYADVLKVIHDPVFSFDGRIDLVVAGDRLVVLSQSAFAMLFRDQEALKGLISKWGDNLSEQIAIEQESLQYIVDKANRDSRQRQRLEAIVMKGHLQPLQAETVKTAMKTNEMDPDRFFDENDKLRFSEGDVDDVLYFLNEDLYRGMITGDPYRADKKASI